MDRSSPCANASVFLFVKNCFAFPWRTHHDVKSTPPPHRVRATIDRPPTRRTFGAGSKSAPRLSFGSLFKVHSGLRKNTGLMATLMATPTIILTRPLIVLLLVHLSSRFFQATLAGNLSKFHDGIKRAAETLTFTRLRWWYLDSFRCIVVNLHVLLCAIGRHCRSKHGWRRCAKRRTS